jgi:hypothetical protein
MNAPVRTIGTIGDIFDFIEVCDQQEWFYAEGWVSLQTAVDNLQYLAERWRLVDLYGQDAVQDVIAFLPEDQPDESPPADFGIANIPPRSPLVAHYRTSQSVIDAFFYVARLDDPEYLRQWFAQHSLDTPFLCKQLLESKNAQS